MTVMAILIVVLRSATDLQEVWLWVAVLLMNNLGIALSTFIIYDTRWPRVLKTAAIAGIAILFGALLALIRHNAWEMSAINLIHAFVLYVWLELGLNLAGGDESPAATVDLP
jgi:hypothetical protein